MPDADPKAPAPEFHRPVAIADLGESAGRAMAAEAGEAERDALARRYGVEAVPALSLEAEIAPWGPEGWRVEGRVRARIAQTCVVTLEPLVSEIDEPLRRWFAPEAALAAAAARLTAEQRDDLEALGEAIDLGEIAAEAAALAIDPYPRRPGVAFEGRIHGPPEAEPLTDEAARPFAKLAALKRGE